jgi:hypothetical protein
MTHTPWRLAKCFARKRLQLTRWRSAFVVTTMTASSQASMSARTSSAVNDEWLPPRCAHAFDKHGVLCVLGSTHLLRHARQLVFFEKAEEIGAFDVCATSVLASGLKLRCIVGRRRVAGSSTIWYNGKPDTGWDLEEVAQHKKHSHAAKRHIERGALDLRGNLVELTCADMRAATRSHR